MLASLKVEASFLQFGYNYSILLIKSGIFHSIGSNRTVVLTGAKGSNRITLTHSNRCMLSQYDSVSGQGYVQSIQTVDVVCLDFDDFEISCDFLLTSYF